MAHEPCGLNGDAKHPRKLVGTHALLARSEKMDGKPPFRERNLGALKNRSDRYGELLLAIAAVVQAGARRLALDATNFRDAAAVRANRAMRPQKCFDGFAGEVVVSEGGGLDIGGGHFGWTQENEQKGEKVA